MSAHDDREFDARVSDITEAIIDSVRAGDDLGYVLSLSLGYAAAREGGVERLLRARPGSWEATDVRHLAQQFVPHLV